MTLDQILRRIRRRPTVPEYSLEDLDESARTFVKERSKGFEGWTDAELDGRTRQALAGHEDELREALAESDRHRAERRRAQRTR